MKPILSIVHPTNLTAPTADFPQAWRETCDALFRALPNASDAQYVLVVHRENLREFLAFDNPKLSHLDLYAFQVTDHQSVFYLQMPLWVSVILVVHDGGKSLVDLVNAGAAAAQGDTILVVPDGLIVDGKVPPGEFIPRDGEWVRQYSADGDVFAISRERFLRYDWILDPQFSDRWAVAYLYAQAANHDILTVEKPFLFIPRRSQRPLSQGEDFAGLRTYCRKLGLPEQKSIAVCLPGEHYSRAWVAAWTSLFGHLVVKHQAIVMTQFAYSTNVYFTRMDMAEAVAKSEIPADLVLWIDDDNTLTAEQFDLLAADLEEHPELSGVVGWCWCGNNQEEAHNLTKWVASVGKMGRDLSTLRFDADEMRRFPGPLVTSRDIATMGDFSFWSGFPVVLMRGVTLECLGPQAFAPIIGGRAKFTGEDISFFANAHEAGMQFAVDLRVRVPHLKLRAIEPIFEFQPKPRLEHAEESVCVNCRCERKLTEAVL